MFYFCVNMASRKALLKARFKKVGTLKKTLFRDGVWEDSIIYQVTNDQRGSEDSPKKESGLKSSNRAERPREVSNWEACRHKC